MIDKNEMDALERIHDAVVERISALARTILVCTACMAVWIAMLFAMTWWLT